MDAIPDSSLQEMTSEDLLGLLVNPVIIDGMNAVELMQWRRRILSLILIKSCPRGMKALEAFNNDRLINTSMAVSIARRGIIPSDQMEQHLAEGNSLIRL